MDLSTKRDFEDQIDREIMPYRTELRRPDLKGTFRCSLCSKIFCHSSSLSRHRMQAHFKSYTCTLCNKEITSNETLRAHMYKKHQISRMFMCRCCNWAFPDKTSLHIHMQAMATGNPGNVSIIAKSSTSPPPGAQAIAAAALNGIDLDASPQSRSPSPVSSAGMNGIFNSASPMSMSTAGLPGGIFPAMPSREDLINRMRDASIFGKMGNSVGTNAQDMTQPGRTSNGPTFDFASLFPNIAAAAKLTSMNPAALASLFPPGFLASTISPNANGVKQDLDQKSERKLSEVAKGGDEEEEDGEVEGAMVIDESQREINGEMENDDEGMMTSDVGEEHAMDRRPSEQDSIGHDTGSPNVSQNGSRRSSLNVGGSVTVNVGFSESSLQKQSQDLPVLRSAISASPLNSLLYHKKLNNALRNKNSDPSLMANFFYPSPLEQLRQAQMQLVEAAQDQQSHIRRDHQQRRKSSSTLSTSSLINDLAMAANGFLRSNGVMKREHSTPSPMGSNGQCEDQQHNYGGSDEMASHISPTETSVGSSSASTASSAGKISPSGALLDTTANGTSNGDLCGQCTVLKGRLALAENRCRFLESKTTSQESKISRLESRIGTLESNGRRYENEAHMLRDHCEQLERKVLDCQERVLRFLQGQQYDQETTKQMLYDILDTCRVYKQA